MEGREGDLFRVVIKLGWLGPGKEQEARATRHKEQGARSLLSGDWTHFGLSVALFRVI
jgi:hypothetical protein